MKKDKSLADYLSEELKSRENTGSDEQSVFLDRELDVFISYSSLNKNVADAVVSNFEQHGIRCWYAPRDIIPGQEWVTAIHEAINACKLFVLIYTDSSNESKQVANEVAIAFNSGKTLIPFRLSDTEMSSELEYYLTRVHWLDAVKPPLMQSIESLRVYSEKILKGEVLKEAGIKNANNNTKKQNKNYLNLPFWVLPSIIVIATGLLVIAIILLFRDDKKSTGHSDTVMEEFNGTDNSDIPDVSDILDNSDIPDVSQDDNNDSSKKDDADSNVITGTEQNSSDAIFKKAYEIQMSDSIENKYMLAYEEYMKTADTDITSPEIADAMAELAGRFAREDGVELDYDKAIKLYEKAILSGNVSSINAMGLLYQNGDGVEEDVSKALDYYKRAAELGDINAMINAGTLYQYGAENVETDIEEALKYYKMALEKGDGSAKSKYEALAASLSNQKSEYENEEEKLQYLELLYNTGSRDSLTGEDYYFLAYHFDSDPLEKDQDKAYKYAFEGANAGSVDCMLMIGNAYWYGNGVEQDYNKVLEWFGKALDSGIEGYNRKYCINALEALVEEGHITSQAAAKWLETDQTEK